MVDVLISVLQYFVWQSVAFRFVPIVDLFTNFLCVMFCYPAFGPYYSTYCAVCDQFCSRTLKRCFSKMMTDHVLANHVDVNTKTNTDTDSGNRNSASTCSGSAQSAPSVQSTNTES